MKFVYGFNEGDATMKDLLGGKGANLAEMTRMGLPVPQGFTITTEACLRYVRHRTMPKGLMEQIREAVADLERSTGKRFGGESDMLLLSVRSGAKFSMPGMMDTILNLGLNDRTVADLAKATSDPRFAYDSYRRFIQMFGDVVLGVEHDRFEAVLLEVRESEGVKHDHEISIKGLKRVISEYQGLLREIGREFPQDPWVQLWRSIEAVFGSWDNPRAKTYRRLNRIPDDLGTAVNIQMMVFGNMGMASATGVAFTRNPSTGEREYYGEYLINAQGEDVVAGIRTPIPLANLEKDMKKVFLDLQKVFERLESHFTDMQDFEFTVENGKLYILQTRNGKRTPQAAVKIAVDMGDEGLIDRNTAIGRVRPEQLETLLHRQIDPAIEVEPIAKGLSASPGAASGAVVFNADDSVRWKEEGKRTVLVRIETRPDDIHGFDASEGILTATGGMTSHAAVVARSMGRPCVAGAESVKIDYAERRMTIGEHVIEEGDLITIDGTKGEVMLGELPMVEAEISGDLERFLSWTDSVRRLGVRANADTPEGARQALRFGAEGIGLCRTERMFNSPERLPFVVAMILAEDQTARKPILDKLFEMQRSDFREIFTIMEERPVTVRLLDPPLHEFMPSRSGLSRELELLRTVKTMAKVNGDISTEMLPDDLVEEIADEGLERVDLMIEQRTSMLEKMRDLFEINPMLGHRGVRLGITHPDIYEMQIRAIAYAVAELIREGRRPNVEIMVPQVSLVEELRIIRDIVAKVLLEVSDEFGFALPIRYGTMIEVVRACLIADQIASKVEFFSFGTNDLTQATFSFSREDSEGKFLPAYEMLELVKANPFSTLDEEGVGDLMRIAVERGRSTSKNLKIGICGEHGGDPDSIRIVHEIGLDYVSCSPFRIPIARLAAARAALGLE